jgi:hypothetical protein
MWQDMVCAIPWPSPKPDLRIVWDLSHTFDDRSSSATVREMMVYASERVLWRWVAPNCGSNLRLDSSWRMIVMLLYWCCYFLLIPDDLLYGEERTWRA